MKFPWFGKIPKSNFATEPGCSTSQIYNRKADRSIAAFDLPNIFTVDFAYELPVGKNKLLSTHNRALDYILGNWQLNGLLQFDSGTPYSLQVSGDIANIGSTFVYERPNLIGNPAVSNQTVDNWFNKNAFGTPAPFTYGNLGRDTMRTPFFHQVDLSVFRNFPIRERATIQFRAESFNTFNNVVYGQPGTTLGAPNFGVVSSIGNSPRTLQLVAKFVF